MAFPTALDSGATLPSPAASDKTNSPSHSALHGNVNTAVIAVETKLGTGASTPVANTFLFGTGTGTSAWTQATSAQIAAAVSDETGSGSLVFGTTPTLITPKVDTINESTPSNGVTVAGLNIKSGAITTANSTPAGSVVQVVYSITPSALTGTTVIPNDTTIPQNTEGDQYFTLSITPKSTTNTLIIDTLLYIQSSVANNLILALFQDSTANALAANLTFQTTAATGTTVALRHIMTSGTTSSTTFKIRAGGSSAGTTTLNGLFGASARSSMTIWEYKS